MFNILDLPGWTILRRGSAGDVETFKAEYVHDAVMCGKCGAPDIRPHGSKTTTYADVPLRNQVVKIEARVRRYRCNKCNATFLQPLTDVLPNRRMTIRCRDFICDAALTRTFADVARQVGLDEKTVRSVAASRVANTNPQEQRPLPRVLGIDETRIGGKLRLVLTDLEKRLLLDLLPDQKEASLSTWLKRAASDHSVDVVVMDLATSYRKVVRHDLPGAIIVADKFHVIRLANDALDSVYRRRRTEKPTIRGRRPYTMSSVALKKRPENLTEKQRRELPLWLIDDPELRAAYQAKESFHSIFNMSRLDAARAFVDFATSMPDAIAADFRPLLSALRKWREEILAMFEHEFTNAYTEWLNGDIKRMSKAGRGYKFEELRARALSCHGEKPKKSLQIKYLIKDANNPCGNCGVLCLAKDMWEVTLPPVKHGQRSIQSLVCNVCEPRFNPANRSTGRAKSTRKSG